MVGGASNNECGWIRCMREVLVEESNIDKDADDGWGDFVYCE